MQYSRGTTSQPFVVMVGGMASDSTSPVSRGAAIPFHPSPAIDANTSFSANASLRDVSEAGSTRAVAGGRSLAIRGTGSPLTSALYDGGGSPGSGAALDGESCEEDASVDFSGFEIPSLISQQLPAPVSSNSNAQHTPQTPSSPTTNLVSMINNIGGNNNVSSSSRGILSPTGRSGGGRSGGATTTEQQLDPRIMAPLTPNDCSSSSVSLLGIHRPTNNNINNGLSSKSQSISKPLLTPRSGFNTSQTPPSRVSHGTVSGQLYFLTSSTHGNQSSGGYGGDRDSIDNNIIRPSTNGAKVGTWVLGELNLSEEWVHFLSSEGESFAHATATIEAVNVLDYLNYSEHCCIELVVKEQRRESARELRKRRTANLTTNNRKDSYHHGGSGGGIRSRSQSSVHQGFNSSQQQQQQYQLSTSNTGGRLQLSSDDDSVRDVAATIQNSGAMELLPGLFWSSQAVDHETTPTYPPPTPTTTTSVNGGTHNLRTFSSDLQSINGGGGGGGGGSVAPYNDPTCERIVLCALDMSSMWEWLDVLDQFLDLPALTRSGISIAEAVISPADPAMWATPHPTPTTLPAPSVPAAVAVLLSSPRDHQLSTAGVNVPPRSPSAPPSPSPSVTLQTSVSPGESQSMRTPHDDDDVSNLSTTPLQRKTVQWGGEGIGSGIDPMVASGLLQRQTDLIQQIKKIKSAALQLRRQVESQSKPTSSKRSNNTASNDHAFQKAVSVVKAVLHTLSTTSLAAAVEDVIAAHPTTPVLTRHIPQTTNPQVATLSKELFVQLDRFHRAASRELAKVEVSLSELYPSTRECRGSRPMDLTLSQYTGLFASRVADNVRRQSQNTFHSIVTPSENTMTSMLIHNKQNSTTSSSSVTPNSTNANSNNSHNATSSPRAHISQMAAWSNSSALASRLENMGVGTASSSSASMDSLVGVPTGARAR